MDKRTFIGAGAALALGKALVAGQNCQQTPRGAICTAQVNIPQLISAIHTQQCPEWCWAACISMIFDFYGHPIDQAEIVRQTFGNVVCFPAGATRTIGQALSRRYVDSNGDKFMSRVVAAFDPVNGINTLDNSTVVHALANDNPLLYCNTAHAMVNYSVRYIPTSPEPTVLAVGVIDPWPTSPRSHLLNQYEMVPSTRPGGQMTFLAAVEVTDL